MTRDITLPSFLTGHTASFELLDHHQSLRMRQRQTISEASRPEPLPVQVIDIDRLRAQIALLTDADCIATFVTELIRRGMLDDMRLAIMDAKAERMRG